MEINNDYPDHFELLPKYPYIHSYVKDAIMQLPERDLAGSLVISIDIYVLANKYDIPIIYEPITKDIQELLTEKTSCTLEALYAVLNAHYQGGTTVDGALVKTIAATIPNNFSGFVTSVGLPDLLSSQPVFAADAVPALQKEYAVFEPVTYTCNACRHSGAGKGVQTPSDWASHVLLREMLRETTSKWAKPRLSRCAQSGSTQRPRREGGILMSVAWS